MKARAQRRARSYAAHGALPPVVALVLAAVLTGCTGARPSAHHPPPSAPAPRTTPPQVMCASLITHWAVVLLSGGKDAGLDYQEMGLSDGQNTILLDIVAAARTERQRHGTAAAQTLIDRRAKERCAERYRTGTPT